MNRSRILIVRAAVVAGLVGATAACSGEDDTQTSEAVRAIKTVTVTEVASGQVRRYAGTIEPADSSMLSFQVAGNVREIAADVGEQIRRDDVLARLDGKPYELDLQAAQADLERAQADFTQKKTGP